MKIPVLCKSRAFLLKVLSLCAILFFSAHAFCYANLTFSGRSVMIDAASGYSEYLRQGQFLIPYYLKLRGSLSAPSLIGMLSYGYLALSAWLILCLLGIRGRLASCAVCASLLLLMPVTAINASMLHLADTYFLSLLLSVLSCMFCLGARWGFLPASVLSVCTLALQPSMLPVFPALLLLSCICSLRKQASLRDVFAPLVQAVFALIIGMIVYSLGHSVMAARAFGTSIAASFRSLWLDTGFSFDPAAALFSPVQSLITLPTAYPVLQTTLYIALLLSAAVSLFLSIRTLPRARAAVMVFFALLVPLALSMPLPFSSSRTAVCEQHALFILPVMITVLLSDLPCRLNARYCQAGAAAALITLSMGSIVFTNQVYLKKGLEMHSTLSAFSRIISLAEQTSGYHPGSTPVAIIGTLEDSVLAKGHQGFEHVQTLDAASNTFAAVTPQDTTWYIWSILGYPFNLVSDYERDLLLAHPQVQNIPAFPAQDCCQFVGDTLVIRLSDTL